MSRRAGARGSGTGKPRERARDRPLEAGQTIANRYRLVRPLGEGAMATVWLAEDLGGGEQVALKRLSPGPPEYAEALRDEFARLARLIHPNIVRVHDFGFDARGVPYFTMEFVEGSVVHRGLTDSRPDNVLALVEGACAGLAAIHSAGFVHGDVKPENLLVVGGPPILPAAVRLVDLGLSGPSETTGRPRGTLGYAAPEILDRESPTARSDLYGLGATLYQALTGRPPFEGRDVAEVVRSQTDRAASPLPLRAAGVPGEMERVLLQLLERNPSDRPATAAEVWEALAPLARTRSPRRPVADAALVRGALLGREAELREVFQRLEDGGAPILLTGPTGVGRTRFLRELALRTEVEGGSTVLVSCAGRGDAGVEWLRRIALVLGLGGSETPWSELLRRASGGRHLFLLEDLHRASSEDLEIARQALSTQVPEGVSVVLSWAEPAPESSPLFEEFRLLASGPWVGQAPLHLRLDPLDEATTAECVRRLLGGAELPEVERAVYAVAGGTPAWIEAALEDWIENGALRQEAGRWHLDPDADLERPLPGFEERIVARLSRLEPEALRWLAALGKLGGDAPSEAVARVAAVDGEAEHAVLAAGLALRDPTGTEATIRAQPAFACTRAFAELPEEERRALLERAAAEPGLPPETAAELWLEAGRPESAIEALSRRDDRELPAAHRWKRESLRLRAHEAAGTLRVEHREGAAVAAQDAQRFRDAGALWESFADEAPDEASRARGRLRAAECWRSLAEYGHAARSLDTCERTLEDASGIEPSTAARLRSSIESERAWLAMTQGDHAVAESHARRALELAPDDAGPERFTAWNRLAAILPRLGRLEDGEEAVDRALELARELGDEIAEARAHGNAIFIARLRGDLVEERRHLEAAYAVSQKYGLTFHACREASALANILYRTGTLEETRNAQTRAEALARSVGDLSMVFTVLQDGGELERRIGNLHRARKLGVAALRLAAHHRMGSNEGWIWNLFADLHSLGGRPRSALRCYRRALSSWANRGRERGLAFPLLGMAKLSHDRGDTDRTNRLLMRAERACEGFILPSAELVRFKALLAARRSDVSAVRDAIKSAPDPSELRATVEGLGAIKDAEAYLAFARRDFQSAIAKWETTHRLYSEKNYPLKRGTSLADAARTLAGVIRDHPEMASTTLGWLQEARTIFQRHGANGPLLNVLADLVHIQEDIQRDDDSPQIKDARDTIYEVSSLLNSLTDFPDLLSKALRLVAQRLSAERGLIVLVDPETGDLEPVGQFGSNGSESADELQISTTIVRKVAEEGTPFRSHDATHDPRLERVKSIYDLSLRSILCAPLRIRDQIIGTIYLQNRAVQKTFTDADVELLEAFANLIAVAIQNSRFHAELRKAHEALLDENVTLRREVTGQYQYTNLVGQSLEMRQVRSIIDRFARVPADILIQGDTGTGKELVAKTVHYNSPRRNEPFLAVNCVAFPENLIEAELFGIEAKVATGVEERKGIFERAGGGTVLLDEIGDMPPQLQTRLLRVLQEREFTRVGGKRTLPMKARVIAATHVDLQQRVNDGTFRADLYFRIKRLVIELPPLRERKTDVPILARFFAEQFCDEIDRSLPRFSPRLLEVMARSDWPGNVRELQHYVERLVVMSDGDVLEPLVLPTDLENTQPAASSPSSMRLQDFHGSTLPEVLQELERDLIQQALRQAGGNRSRAARLLGLAEPTLRYRLRKLGIEAHRKRS